METAIGRCDVAAGRRFAHILAPIIGIARAIAMSARGISAQDGTAREGTAAGGGVGRKRVRAKGKGGGTTSGCRCRRYPGDAEQQDSSAVFGKIAVPTIQPSEIISTNLRVWMVFVLYF